jgi:hypothetical protein
VNAFTLSFANDYVGDASSVLDDEHGSGFVRLRLALAGVGCNKIA